MHVSVFGSGSNLVKVHGLGMDSILVTQDSLRVTSWTVLFINIYYPDVDKPKLGNRNFTIIFAIIRLQAFLDLHWGYIPEGTVYCKNCLK